MLGLWGEMLNESGMWREVSGECGGSGERFGGGVEECVGYPDTFPHLSTHRVGKNRL